VRVFDHEGRYPGALAVLERLNDGMVLAVRIKKVIVHAGKVDLVEGYGVGSGKRNTPVAFQRLRNDLTPGSMDNQRMELLIHVAVASFVQQDEMPFGKNLVAFVKALVQGV
jgi:hypothetical protein